VVWDLAGGSQEALWHWSRQLQAAFVPDTGNTFQLIEGIAAVIEADLLHYGDLVMVGKLLFL